MKTAKVWFDRGFIHLQLEGGAIGSLPLKAFPRLYNASGEQRLNFTLSPMGIHWAAIDEDLSFDGFFAPQTKSSNRISQLFLTLPEINVNQFARLVGVNQSLMAKYICGAATPSEDRVHQIEASLHQLGRELLSVRL